MGVERKTDNLFLDVVALDTTIANFENFGCLIQLSFAGEPPRRFREKDEDDSDEADHRPLGIGLSLAEQIKCEVQLAF